ncbi:MAG: hypothetical protein SFV53_03540 [Rickettsiales bacterium]|nr:hypothetical protein [Rickettsiales bacterium]
MKVHNLIKVKIIKIITKVISTIIKAIAVDFAIINDLSGIFLGSIIIMAPS